MNFKLLNVVASYKYLGHYLTDDRSDDEDRGSINRQRRQLFVQGNIIINVHNELFIGVRQLTWQHLSPVVSTFYRPIRHYPPFHKALHPLSLSFCPSVSLLFLWYPIPFS